MDTKSLGQHPDAINAADPVKSSRLPAGSTLEVMPGVHIPHPHAEVNLPGAGDPRLGDTKAVTETVVVDDDGKSVVDVRPLADEVKAKVVKVVDAEPGLATEADKQLVVEEPDTRQPTE